MSYSIKDLKNSDKPRERLNELGSSSLSDTELLAIIISSGGKNNSALEVASKILSNYKGLEGLIQVSVEELKNFKNIGAAKAAAIKAAVEIGLRAGKSSTSQVKTINKPQDVFTLLKKDLWGKDVEHLYLISLDSRNKFIRKDLMSTGTVNETLIHPREVYKKALQAGAVSIILAHNHPSGEILPSEDDIEVTKRIMNVGFELGIPLIDHLIIYNDEFISLKSLDFTAPKQLKGGDKE